MTGHVAQVIADDETWHKTLAAIHRALRPGGRVAFESRNPKCTSVGSVDAPDIPSADR